MGERAGGELGGPAADRGVVPTSDRDLPQALVYAMCFVLAAGLTYLFNALLGRNLAPQDFSTFAAFLAVLLALNGPSTALFGGGAMSSARTGALPRTPWRRGLLALGAAALVAAVSPLPPTIRAGSWFLLAILLLMLVAWNRGLLTGIGRLGQTGGTMVVDGVLRIAFAMGLVLAGFGLVGASAGLALGVAAGWVLTEVLVPRRAERNDQPIAPEVWVSIFGLLFVGMVQFVDVVAVRVFGGERVGDYAAASSLARVAMYAQLPAAAYAIRRAAVAGAHRAGPRVALLAMAPAVVVLAAMEAFPGQLLSLTYGGNYASAAPLVRVLAVAMFLAGATTVMVNLMLGAGRTGWVGSAVPASVVGTVLIVALAGRPERAVFGVLAAQAMVCMVALAHVRRLLSASRGADGSLLVLNWRDARHPQGGGSEVFVEEVGRRLAASGRRVTIFCAAHGNAPREEVRDGVRYLRRGSWRTVYLWAALYHLGGRFGPHDVVVDVQNAIPFFSPLYCGRPVVALVHHVHREQWGMVFGRRVARAGWWVESRLAPLVYRRATYVAVSEATRGDLIALGVGAERIHVVRNGAPEVVEPEPVPVSRAVDPTIVYLGRLVPHKRVELLLQAAAQLRSEFPRLRVRLVGQGLWEPALRREAARLGVEDVVAFEGFIGEEAKRRALREAWVLGLPSVMEGWGLVVMEAAAQGTPAVAYRVGGLSESVVHGETGILAETQQGFVAGLRALLTSRQDRERMGEAARVRATAFSWDHTAAAMSSILDGARVPVGSVTWTMPQPAVEPV